MKRRNRKIEWKRPVLIAVFLALLVATAAPAKRYLTTGFRTTESRPITIAVLPPHADFIKKKILVSHELVKEAEVLERAAADAIANHLRGRGYEVKLLTVEEVMADDELQHLIGRMNDRYDLEWRQLVRRPKKVRVRRYSIGIGIRDVAGRLGVDGIAVPRIQAVGATGGQKAMAYLFGGNAGYARLDLGVVHGKTGDVEAYFFGLVEAGFKSLTQKPDKMMKRVTKVTLRNYPKSSKVLNPKKEDVRDEEEDLDAETEAAILGDLEALLGTEPPNDGENHDEP